MIGRWSFRPACEILGERGRFVFTEMHVGHASGRAGFEGIEEEIAQRSGLVFPIEMGKADHAGGGFVFSVFVLGRVAGNTTDLVIKLVAVGKCLGSLGGAGLIAFQ